jgi:biopolymer transport protein TolR
MMAAGGRPKRRLMGEINVVPYIDVMLVLLIIFMITAPLLTQGIKVDLPKAAAEPIDATAVNNIEPLVLSVDARGRFFLNLGANPLQALDDATALARATAALRRTPRRVVLVKGDRAVDYGRIVAAMVMLQQAGASKLGFLTEPPPAAVVQSGAP